MPDDTAQRMGVEHLLLHLDIRKFWIFALSSTDDANPTLRGAVYTQQDAEQAWGVFTGDALFFGTTGRTDLPGAEQSEQNVALLYDSVHDKLAPLGDATLVLPAHGPGSVCGMAPLPMSSLGAEKRYNEVFTKSRDEFAEAKGSERIPRPPYFRLMEKVNLSGGMPPVRQRGDVELLSVADFASVAHQQVVDVRDPEGFAAGQPSHPTKLCAVTAFALVATTPSTAWARAVRELPDDYAYRAARVSTHRSFVASSRCPDCAHADAHCRRWPPPLRLRSEALGNLHGHAATEVPHGIGGQLLDPEA